MKDRAFGILKMKRTKIREAKQVSCAIKELLEEWIPYIKTMTADNGKEFGDHLSVAEVSQTDIYFANPYSSWQRGANENLNVS
jgi:IS30 family transposase